LWQAALIALLTAVVVAAAGVWLARQQLTVAAPDPGEPAEPPATATVEATAAPSVVPSATASAAASASASASADSGALPTASASASADGRDGSELPPSRGYLIVHFPTVPEGQVYLLGKKFGAPGQKLDVPCGRTFVRVGKAPGPSWLSTGVGLKVECQSVTEITLDQP
jgi:hypothetical protein